MKPNDRFRHYGMIVACMPKSGSTFLTTLIASLPGMRRAMLVPGHHRREQEICLRALQTAFTETQILRQLFRQKRIADTVPAAGFVAQMHVRYSVPTAKIMKTHGISPIVLVRDIFDVVVSLRDHLHRTAPFMSMGYVDDEMRMWPAEKMYEFIADMVVPWYLNFFMCWSECSSKLLINYETLTADPKQTLQRVAAFANLRVTEADIDAAVLAATGADTRKNIAVSGRGKTLDPRIKEKIHRLAAYYPNVDFSPIGLNAGVRVKASAYDREENPKLSARHGVS